MGGGDRGGAAGRGKRGWQAAADRQGHKGLKSCEKKQAGGGGGGGGTSEESTCQRSEEDERHTRMVGRKGRDER